MNKTVVHLSKKKNSALWLFNRYVQLCSVALAAEFLFFYPKKKKLRRFICLSSLGLGLVSPCIILKVEDWKFGMNLIRKKHSSGAFRSRTIVQSSNSYILHTIISLFPSQSY